MNREIKFRAWVKEDSEMKGYFIPHDSHELNYSELIDAHNDNGCTILMQFTGLHDKNSKEIYEGDILAPFGNITQEPQIENCFLVEYSNGSYNIGKESDTDYCVIGNIYENPELCNL